MLDHGTGVATLDVGEGVRRAAITDQQGIALRVVARPVRARAHAHQSAIGVGTAPGGNPLGDNRGFTVLAQVDHLGAGVRLLPIVGQGHGVELSDAVLAAQHAARILPGDGRAGLYLSPGNLAVIVRDAAFGHEVINAAAPLRIARIPVLHRGVFDFGAVEGHQFNHRGVQLVFIAHRRRAALQIAHMTAFIGDDQRALELAGLGLIDAEVSGQLHGTAHALGNVHEGAVAEDGAVQGRVEVVAARHHAA